MAKSVLSPDVVALASKSSCLDSAYPSVARRYSAPSVELASLAEERSAFHVVVNPVADYCSPGAKMTATLARLRRD